MQPGPWAQPTPPPAWQPAPGQWGAPQPWSVPPPAALPPGQVDPNTDLARLDRVLRHQATNGRLYGIATGVAGLVVGGVTIPTGIYMLNRATEPGTNVSDPMPAAILIGVGIGSAAGGILSFFISTGDLDSLGRSLEDKEEQGEPPAQIVAEIEHDWREKAESTHSTRKAFGILSVIGGAIVMGVGAGFAIADPISGLTVSEQQLFGTLLMGGGAVNVFGGFSQIFIETPVESTWEIYQSFKGPGAGYGAPMPQPLPPPTFGFAPLRDGVLVTSQMRF
jgi:hypothetical protein